jgi:hypothetical protein
LIPLHFQLCASFVFPSEVRQMSTIEAHAHDFLKRCLIKLL